MLKCIQGSSSRNSVNGTDRWDFRYPSGEQVTRGRGRSETSHHGNGPRHQFEDDPWFGGYGIRGRLERAAACTAFVTVLCATPAYAEDSMQREAEPGSVNAVSVDHAPVDADPGAEQALLQSLPEGVREPNIQQSDDSSDFEPLPEIFHKRKPRRGKRKLDPLDVYPVANTDEGQDQRFSTNGLKLEDIYDSRNDAVIYAPEEQWTEGDDGDTTLFSAEDEGLHALESGDGLGALDFGSPGRINSPNSYPWRMNVKIEVIYPNGKKGGCSGTLIDSRHALTAAHCIHDKDRGGWATSVKVFPAFEDGASDVYGSASKVGSSGLFTWTPWTQRKNWDYDIGVVFLDRPVGALTGWFGYGYYSCSGLTTPSWFLASYPGQEGFDGKTMQFQSGDFDTCPSEHEARRRRPGISGQSGGGYYHLATGGRYVRAVHSHSQWNWFHGYDADAVRFNSLKYNDVRLWINAHTPFSPDLIPLDVYSPVEATSPGYSISGASYFLHNYSRSGRSGAFTAKVYLSTNGFISQYDTLVQTHTFTYNFGSKTSVRINMPTIQIPRTLPYGDYYLGVIIQDADADISNNQTHGDLWGQDAFKIRVL